MFITKMLHGTGFDWQETGHACIGTDYLSWNTSSNVCPQHRTNCGNMTNCLHNSDFCGALQCAQLQCHDSYLPLAP